MRKDPVFIVGVPRSGTTWLWGLLDSLPSVKTLVAYDGTSESGLFVNNPANTAASLIRAELALLDDGITLVEKTPGHLLYMQSIRDVLPAARIVWVTRDLRDVVASMMHTKHSAFNTTFDKAIKMCNSFLKPGLNQLRNVTHYLSYEDLHYDVKYTFTQLLTDLDIDHTETDVVKSIADNDRRSKIDWNFRKGAVGNFKTELTEAQTHVVEQIFPDYMLVGVR